VMSIEQHPCQRNAFRAIISGAHDEVFHYAGHYLERSSGLNQNEPKQTFAMSWSGGKDSMLALDRAVRKGLNVSHLFNIYEGNSELVRFHGTHHSLVGEQASALGMELIQRHTHPKDYPTVLNEILSSLKELGVTGIIFGNIHLEDIRDWYAGQLRKHDLEHIEPLWGDAPEDLVEEFITLGYVSTVAGVDTSRSDPAWLGRRFDSGFRATLESTPDIDLCGERGEYHTFVSDGPLFNEPVSFRITGQGEIDGHRFLDLRSDQI
jgi:diphthine-ammonia ligase